MEQKSRDNQVGNSKRDGYHNYTFADCENIPDNVRGGRNTPYLDPKYPIRDSDLPG